MCEWLSLIPVVIYAAFIGQWVKHWKSIRHIISVCPVLVGFMLQTAAGYFTVVGGDSFTASLFEAKHQVNPLVKVLRHILTLQRCPVLLEKITGIWSGDRQDTGKCGTEGTMPHVDGRARLVYMHTMTRGSTGRYLRPTAGERHHPLSFHSAFGPNQDSVCFPESCCRPHKTLESAAT